MLQFNEILYPITLRLSSEREGRRYRGAVVLGVLEVKKYLSGERGAKIMLSYGQVFLRTALSKLVGSPLTISFSVATFSQLHVNIFLNACCKTIFVPHEFEPKLFPEATFCKFATVKCRQKLTQPKWQPKHIVRLSFYYFVYYIH